jgi:hypothetical protein
MQIMVICVAPSLTVAQILLYITIIITKKRILLYRQCQSLLFGTTLSQLHPLLIHKSIPHFPRIISFLVLHVNNCNRFPHYNSVYTSSLACPSPKHNSYMFLMSSVLKTQGGVYIYIYIYIYIKYVDIDNFATSNLLGQGIS